MPLVYLVHVAYVTVRPMRGTGVFSGVIVLGPRTMTHQKYSLARPADRHVINSLIKYIFAEMFPEVNLYVTILH